jgi:hypothetical protein
MKNSMKYWLIVAMVMVGVSLLTSGNASAVILTPPPSVTVIGSAPMVSPVFGSGIVPGVGIAPRPIFSQPFVQPFFPFFRPFFPFFNPFNPFFNNVDPFIGVGVNPGFVD